MPENSSNKFEEHFGLIPIDPTKNFYEHPCAGTLADMPKAVQTEEMVLLALETERPYAFPVLSCAAAALKTEEICDKAVISNVLNFLYTPKKYRTAERCLRAVSRDTCEFTGEHAILSAVPEDVYDLLRQHTLPKQRRENGLLWAISEDVRKGKYAAQGMPKLIENYLRKQLRVSAHYIESMKHIRYLPRKSDCVARMMFEGER